VAHTSEEHVDLEELNRSVEGFERLARACLEEVPVAS
jgi:hypothetical protein